MGLFGTVLFAFNGKQRVVIFIARGWRSWYERVPHAIYHKGGGDKINERHRYRCFMLFAYTPQCGIIFQLLNVAVMTIL